MNKNTAIKVTNLSKVYKLYDKPVDRLKEALNPLRKSYHKEFYALDNINFEIKKGETVGIIGKNGAGKSTLLKIITGVLTPSSGHVQVNGRIASLLELGAGFNPEYTGVENIYLQGTLMGYSKEEMESKIQAVLDFADIGDFVYQPVKSYSSGMFARLAFAVAINVNPDILIVDEALSVGDMNFQAKCMTAMDRIKQKGTTILFVSHDINSVKSLCEKGIYIKNGTLHAIGKASDIAEMYIKEMREDINEEHKKFVKYTPQEDDNEAKTNTTHTNKNSEFKTSEEFDKKVAQFRYGSGGARITYVELLDEENNPVIEAEFNQKVKIRLYVEADTNLEDISINFQIFDDKKILITVGNFQVANQNLIHIEEGKKYIVDYKLALPLQDGVYSIQGLVSTPIVKAQSAQFLDVVPDAFIFRIAQNKHTKIWGKVHLFPEINILKVSKHV